ncbi:MAG: hypothetical protein H0X62_14995 [Bacteroidetes bacterium]|jgi:hypothetical protein|nr:hypothetical protein [Bacteroidota bacterium]
MNSPFAKIYLALMDRIKLKVPAIIHIDHDLGQLEGASARPSVAFPCVLTDFDQWQFENMGVNAQTAQGDVIVKLAFAQFGNSSGDMPEQWKKEALKYYDLEWDLHKALQGWSPGEDYGYLTRTNVSTENRAPGIRIRTMRYRLEFEDYSAKPTQTTMQTPELDLED